MANKAQSKSKVAWYDILAAIFTFYFVYSIIICIQSAIDGGIHDSPAYYSLIASVIFLAYGIYVNRKLTDHAQQAILMLGTSILIWGFGVQQWLS